MAAHDIRGAEDRRRAGYCRKMPDARRPTRNGNRYPGPHVATVVGVNSAQPDLPSVRTSAAVAVRSQGRRWALGSAGLLLLGGLVVGMGALIGVVHTYDGSPPGMAGGAVWVVVLPAVVALVLAGWRPTLGLAAAAGAGVVATARLISDLSLLTGPNTAIRPEFFYEVSDRAQPFTTAGGAWVVLAGDLVMICGGTLAAHRLSRSLSFGSEPIFDVAPPPQDGADSGPELLAEALESADSTQATDTRGAGPGSSGRNNWQVSFGFLGILGLLIASLGLPYTGGYPTARYLPPELDLWGIGAALAIAVVATIAVLAAAVLPRQIALALLGGLAIGAATPFLTAVAVRTVGAPVHLGPVVGLGLLGAVLVAAAGLLARARLLEEHDDGPSDAVTARWNASGAVLTLLVAAASAAAWKLPQLRYNGGADPKLADGYAISAPLALPFLLASVVPLIGGLLWLVPRLARAGRAVATIAWLALVFAVTQSLSLLGQVVTSASVPNAGFAAPKWTAGPGLWCGIAGIAFGLAALAVAAAAGRAVTNSSPLVADEDLLDRSRGFGALLATGLTVLTIIALALPVYRTAAGPSATLIIGFAVNSWGVLALAVGMVAAAWAAGRAQWVSQAFAYPLAGAGILVVRLVIPPAVQGQDGFRTQAGLYAGYAAVLAFLLAAVLLAVSSKRIPMSDPAAKPLPRRPSGRSGGPQSKVGVTGAVSGRRTGGGRVAPVRKVKKP